jgi:hypothetical protein
MAGALYRPGTAGGLATRLLHRPQKPRLLRPATKAISEKRPEAVFPMD